MSLTFKEIDLYDAQICAALDAESFGKGMFSEEMISSLIKAPTVIGTLLIHQQTPVGYCLLSCIGDEADLLTICIHPQAQGNGFGEILLQHVLTLGQSRHVKYVFLEVRESNKKAISLYKKLGGIEVGNRKNYYDNPKEHALVYKLEM